MRTPPLGLLALLLGVGCTSGTPPGSDDPSAQVAKEVREAAEGLLQAMNAGDPDRVFSAYWDDPAFVYLGCTDVIMGGQTFRQLIRPLYAAQDPVEFDIQIAALQVLGTHAAAVSLRGTTDESTPIFLTQVWRREGEAWRVSMEHGSWPDCPEPRAPHPYTAPPDSAALRTGTQSR